MTVKQFFKSTTFKCIVTLLCVLLVSGILLTIAYGWLEVTDAERFSRSVSKLYPNGMKGEVIEQKIEQVEVGDSTVEKLWLVEEEHDYLVQISSMGRDDRIVTWVIVEMDDAQTKVTGIGTVLVYKKADSEYADKISGWNTNIENFSKDYKDGIEYAYGNSKSDMYINTGASKSFTAICSCVNDAITYVSSIIGGGVNDTPTDVYENFVYKRYIDTKNTSFEYKDGEIVYTIVTKNTGLDPDPYTITVKVGADGKISDFAIVESGAYPGGGKDYPALELSESQMREILVGKTAEDITALLNTDSADPKFSECNLDEIYTGATQSNFIKLYAALFAASNYKLAAENCTFAYTRYIDKSTEYTVENGVVTYTIVTKNTGLDPDPYTITVKVGADGKISDFAIVESGAYPGGGKDYPALELSESQMREILVGKTAEDITALLKTDSADPKFSECNLDEIYTGATQSNFIKLYAALYAASNYGLAAMTGGNN